MSRLGDKVNKLIKEIKRGDLNSFRQLHDLTYNHLTVVAFNYLYDFSEIEDVLNEAYFRIYRYINSADPEKDGYNWLCKTVQNVAYAYNRKHSVTVDIDRAGALNLFYGLEDTIIENTQLLQAVKRLDEEEQQLIYYKFWEDLSYSEIAELKGMKKPTVYKRISSAMKKIAKFLNDVD